MISCGIYFSFRGGKCGMAFKEREESNLLKAYRSLSLRGELSEEERKYYLNLEKGYEGELKFDQMSGRLQSNGIILNDLLLKWNNQEFQIDSTIIFQHTINIFEVKNFEGDYCFDPEIFQTIYGKEINNPLLQLNRAKSLFRQLLQGQGFNLQVEAYVIFINPEFTLFQAPTDIPFVLPSQLNRFMKRLDAKPSTLNTHHKRIAEKLLSLHQKDTTYISKLPKYEYERLRKGITCKCCGAFLVRVTGRKVVCDECGVVEEVSSTVMRCVGEVQLLFPEMRITTNVIYDWCRNIECKRRISRILERNLRMFGYGQWSYFEESEVKDY
jgi:hypothetical protein